MQPERHGALVVVRVDRHLLVVAAQADHRAGLRLLPLHQQLDHAAAVRAAVDVVAEKDPARRPAGGMGLARREEATQLVEAAVDIADREGEWETWVRPGRGADGWHRKPMPLHHRHFTTAARGGEYDDSRDYAKTRAARRLQIA